MRYVVRASGVPMYDELRLLLVVYDYEPILVNSNRLFVVVVDPSDEMFIRMQAIGCTIVPETQYNSEKPDWM